MSADRAGRADDVARGNAHALAVLRAAPGDEADRALRRTRPAPVRLRLRLGRLDWTQVPGLRPAVHDLARAHLDASRADAARPLVGLLGARDPGRAAHELAGRLHLLDGDDVAAEARLTAAAEGPDGRRRATARQQVGDTRRRLDLRAAVAARPVATPRAAAARDDVLAAPWWTPGAVPESDAVPGAAPSAVPGVAPGAVESEAARYLAAAVADGDAAGLDPVLDLLFAGQALAVSTLDAPGVTYVLDRAAVLAADADHDGALRALTALPARPEALTGPALLQLATSLTATSRYDEARTLLRLAATADDERVVAEAHVLAARAAWVTHDDAGTVREARAALRAGASRRVARGLQRRGEQPVTPPAAEAPAGGIGHVAFYVEEGENFGDVALPLAVREAVEAAAGPQEWVPFHAHQLFDAERVRVANTQRALVVGGGGLFLPDTSPNGHSGWQWNVPAASLEALDVPLFVFAVGYNLFDGQEFHGTRFRESLVALAGRAELVGLRNHGSMDRVRDLLPAGLQHKVRFVPCPTTVYERLHADLPPAETGTGRILVNAAFDRSARRFKDGYPAFLAQVHDFAGRAAAAGAEVRLVAHTRGDVRLAQDLREAHGLDLPVDELHLATPAEAFALYRRASLVAGMRGHATMVPFGLGTPVVSLVSHPKMRYFLDDVGRPEWGIDVADPRLADRLAERALDVLAREEDYRDDVRALQLELLPHVQDAAGRVAAALGPEAPARPGRVPAPEPAGLAHHQH
ncbi:polysaccharide pyruvyl transferase family protein [Promicromonospora sp. Marseille-Q5078]